MVKKGIERISLLILLFLIIFCTNNNSVLAAEKGIKTIQKDVKYGQTEARSMLKMINDFRTGAEAWALDENENRIEYKDLGTLTYDYELERIAMQRAAEIAVSFSHTRPNGKSCFSLFEESAYSWYSYGENIAYGYNALDSAESVFEAWQETNENYAGQGHRRNMLNSGYTAVGIGHVYYEGYHYWTQEFGNPVTDKGATSANDTQTVVYIEVLSESISDGENSIQAGWKKDTNGWWYQNSDGSWPANGWQMIDGKWYTFDKNGYMMEGWQQIKGAWYYLVPESGVMAEGWQMINGAWYYLVPGSGAMAEGWQMINGAWYYLVPGSGVMAEGWQMINGAWYYLVPGSGAMAEGWQQIKGIWYYLSLKTGNMKTGWLTLNDDKYYLDNNGAMLISWQKIDGIWYYFQVSGNMAINQWIGDFYVGADGKMLANTWIGEYYVGADGKWIPGKKK